MMESYPAKKKIGIIGGSFDPVHIGHLIIAQDAAERLELAQVLFVPASIPPHKQHLQQADIEHRINMLSLAVETDIRFSVSDIEMQRGGVSYTYDTVRELKALHPDSELVLIVGSDTLLDLHNWYQPQELLSLCSVATLLRPGEHSLEAIAAKIRLPEEQKKRALDNLITAHQVDISSTEIRMRVAEGLGIRYLVPPEVEMYIYEHSLYTG
jgi:nicotinate-nucleotide adenylyltransferase